MTVKADFAPVEEFISSIDDKSIDKYADYWSRLEATTNERYFDRWLFAFMSVHTGWQQNVKGYQAVKGLKYGASKKQLRRAIDQSGVGLTNNRTEGIWRFTHDFWENPAVWRPFKDETIPECRDRLAKQIYGLGLTKTSFVFELSYPMNCDVVCLDSHILRLYGLPTTTPNSTTYHDLEQHWNDCCSRRFVPSPIARHIYWDRVQGQPDTRYWSSVLE